MKEFNPSYIGLRTDLIKHLSGSGLRVLDVGCSTGVNGKYLLDNKIAREVVGIEIDSAMARLAAEAYSNVVVGSLDDPRTLEQLEGQTFDAILAGDVLEHLLEPGVVLRSLRKLLVPTGKAIISLPNVAHVDVALHLFIKGTWPQNDRGIFDATHRRFFTLSDMQQLVTAAGLTLTEYHRIFRARDAIGSSFSWTDRVLKRLRPSLYTFQYILVCTPSSSAT